MMQDLLRSRVALADITGINSNVIYEIGFRHAVLRSATALVMQPGTELPYNLQDDPVVTYVFNHRSKKQIKESIEVIREFLRRSIPPMGTGAPQNDMSALGFTQTPLGSIDIASRIAAAEHATAEGHADAAIELYKRINRTLGGNSLIKMRLGTLLAERPSLQSQEAAQALFAEVAKTHATYSDAHRELGLSQQRMYMMKGRPLGLPTGEEALKTVLKLTPNDLAAKRSLAEILKDKGLYDDAYKLLRQTGLPSAIRSRASQIDHLMRGGVSLDLKPLFRRGASLTYDVTLHNLPPGIARDELNQVFSPLGIKGLEVRSLSHADSTTAIGRLTTGTQAVEAIANRLDHQQIRGRTLKVDTFSTAKIPGGFRGSGKGGGGFSRGGGT